MVTDLSACEVVYEDIPDNRTGIFSRDKLKILSDTKYKKLCRQHYECVINYSYKSPIRLVNTLCVRDFPGQ